MEIVFVFVFDLRVANSIAMSSLSTLWPRPKWIERHVNISGYRSLLWELNVPIFACNLFLNRIRFNFGNFMKMPVKSKQYFMRLFQTGPKRDWSWRYWKSKCRFMFGNNDMPSMETSSTLTGFSTNLIWLWTSKQSESPKKH